MAKRLLEHSLGAICGAALAMNLLLVAGLLALIAANAVPAFWQHRLALLTLHDGTRILGEIRARETIPARQGEIASSGARIQVKTGNRDVTGEDFRWIDESRIADRSSPGDAVVLERLEYGPFYGTMAELRNGSDVVARGSEEVWRAFGPIHERVLARLAGIRKPERSSSGAPGDPAFLAGLASLRERLSGEVLVMTTADGRSREIPVAKIIRALRPNGMSTAGLLGLYLTRAREFLMDDPRESNTEGGIFPAIFGTVLMVFLMTFAAAPLGVLAALFLREYSAQGMLVRMVRIAVNNLAGVPSIVFGIFGLGFFVYTVGGSIDAWFFAERLPSPTFGTGGLLWASLTLALLTVPVVIVATEEGLAAVPRVVREGSLALGATRFETVTRVVLPAAMPGILTGMILAMARAAGEVAPLMIVGMVKLAPALPIGGSFPFVHLERKFMHLGFHIFDLGFQSPNVESTKPLVFATALLLITVVTVMNLLAIALRNRLRRKYATSAF
ncbi:MAG: phosphate ABC transporter permease PstA [Acidobacteria bacterium]|nr:phosphate ABC transporter permease PstA [Acidobacteriota bacterium]